MVFKNFQAFKTEIKNGVYILTKDSCDFCKDNIENLEREEINNISIIDVTPIEINECFECVGASTFPTTILYKDNEILYKKSGILYNKQLKDLKIIANVNQIKLFAEQPIKPEPIKRKPVLVISDTIGISSPVQSNRNRVIAHLREKNKIAIFIEDILSNVYENNFDLDLIFSIVDGFDDLFFVNSGTDVVLDSPKFDQILFHVIALQRNFEVINISTLRL